MNPIRIELPTQFSVGPVNSYLFTEPELILVDTGVASDESWAALLAGLAANGVSIKDVQRVIVTHPHVDHFAQAARLVAEANAQIWIADLGAPWLRQPQLMWQGRIDYYRDYFLPQVDLPTEMQQMAIAYFTTVQQNSPAVPPENLTSFHVGDQLQMGGMAWDVLHMPGHASTQTCFYQPETTQFLSADMLLHKTPTPIVEQPPDGKTRQPALPLFLESLAKVEALPIDTVYPGHGDIFHNAQEVIQRQRARIAQRKEETFAHLQNGAQTASALVDVLYAHYPSQMRFAGLWMLIGYLDLLVTEGRVAVAERDGVFWYTAVS